MQSMEATSLRFWGVMSLATLAGLVVAYLVNLRLFGVKMKRGIGTSRVLGEGGHAVSAERGEPPKLPASHGWHRSKQIDTERQAPLPANANREHMAGPRATAAQISPMTVPTLLLHAAGIGVAALGGKFS